MKKKLFIMTCLAVLGIQVVKAQQSIMALHHNGKATFYTSSKIADALAAATDGDTIYFSTGIFPSDIKITKKITLIGVGDETIVKGNISIAIPDSVKLTKRLFQTLHVNGNLNIDKPVAGVMISQCYFNDINFNASIDSSYIDRSYVNNKFYLSSNIKSLNISTTKIRYISGSCSDVECATFTNCNIYELTEKSFATYVNCIINYLPNNMSAYTVFVNCLANDNTIFNYSYTNCWHNYDLYLNNNMIPNIDISGYKGIDGTVIGAYGTTIPYVNDLRPSTPRVLTRSLEVNDVGTTLTVNLTVGTGEAE